MLAESVRQPVATVITHLIQDPPGASQQEPPPWATTAPPEIDAYGQLPVLASDFDHVDGLFYFTYAVCIFFFVLITGVLLYSAVAHRRKTWDQTPISNFTHPTPLEVIWTIIPLIIVMVMFAWGFKGALDMTTVPQAAKQNTYKASAKQWAWTFTYPDGTQSYSEVWFEIDEPVQVVTESQDVLHAFYLPSMRVKRDVVPGRYQSVWFKPTRIGEYHLFCAEYCGKDHSRMYAKVHVVDSETFASQPWNQVPEADAPPEDRIAYGRQLWKGAGCYACHSVEGIANTGPSWKAGVAGSGEMGLYKKNAAGEIVGTERLVFEDGEEKLITVDEDYIKESIAYPAKKIVWRIPYKKGGMPAANLSEDKLSCLIDFMKSLAAN